MSFEWDYLYDENTLLAGEVEIVDESFDHEFGTEIRKGFEVKNFTVNVLIRKNYYDVTSSMSESDIERMKKEFLNDLKSAYPDKAS